MSSACRSASLPLAAVVTEQPWNFSATCTSSRMFGSSSTTSTCGMRSFSVMRPRAYACLVLKLPRPRPRSFTGRGSRLHPGMGATALRQYRPESLCCDARLAGPADLDQPGIFAAAG